MFIKGKKIIKNLFGPGILISAPVFAISCSQTETYTNQIETLNQGKIDSASLDNLDKLADHTAILEWKNPKTDIAKIQVKNLYLNNFLQNNLVINKNKLNEALKNLGFKHLDKIKAEIVFNEVNRDYSNIEYLSVPVVIKRYIKTVSGQINEFQTRKIFFKLKGLSINEENKKRKTKLENFLKDKYDVQDGLNVVKVEKMSLEMAPGANLDYKLTQISRNELNKTIKLRFKDLENKLYFNNLTQQQKQELASLKKADSKNDLFNVYIESFEVDPQNHQNFIIKFKLAYGSPSIKIKSNRWSVDTTIKNIGVNLVYKGRFKTVDADEFLKQNAIVELKYNLSFTNYPFAQAHKNDFVAKSKVNGLQYEIKSIKKLDHPQRLGFNLKVTNSDVAEFNNKEVYIEAGVDKHTYIFQPELQDSLNKFNLLLGDIDSNILTKITQNIYDKANRSRILPGGYGELRGFYNNKNAPKQLHLGEDVLVKEGTEIIAPFDGDIISLGAAKNEKPFTGIGGQLVLRVKKEQLIDSINQNVYQDLFADAEYVYIGLIHLDIAATLRVLEKNGLNRQKFETEKYLKLDITLNNPLPIKKGAVIGIVGKPSNNGGWMPHAHIATWKQQQFIKDDNGYLYKPNDNTDRYKKYKADNQSFNIRVHGVELGQLPSQSGKINTSEYQTDENGNVNGSEIKKNAVRNTLLNIKDWEINENLFDPNIIFNFRDINSLAFDVHELFNELK
ncbi:lipoprotein [Mycoplasmopsis californica]|uniref:Lipoprotein n=1 Tax=Mycoplasmopsis californica TaxID=2113 RepID=A0A059XM82_9BACT|nr:hypothetical protein [Mycoplasmopsis californica]AIA29629.1 lipoprotein [Mycoplasmopsis californica]